MAYTERCRWCSSSFSSTMCPSNIGKSTKPCLNLSSSLTSTSSSSNSDSIPISTDSISSSSSSSSYEKKKKTLTSIVRSSLGHPNDYYTAKRIDELHERMDDIQISSFLKFINYHLSLKTNNDNKKISINDLSKDLSNGHVLIDLIEILSSTKLKREHGHTRFHSLTNIQYVLDYLKLRMQHINISPHDIVSGNRKQILALLWIIMKTFNFPAFRLTNKNCFNEYTLLGFGQDRSIIIKWLNNIINQSLNTKQIYIKDFYIQTWNNGYYLSIIIKYLIPLSIKYLTIKYFDYLKELNKLNLYDKKCFELCLNLSNYCFNTITIIDYTDKSEKCLFKYFTELYQNIFIILKTNHIGKLIQNNPYTKQILDTVIQTKTEYSSYIINNNEEYLICIDDDNQQVSNEKHTRLADYSTLSSDDNDELLNLRTVEKSSLFNDEQEKIKLKQKNRWEEVEDLQSNSHMVNGHNETSKERQIEAGIDESEQLNGTVEEIEQGTNDHMKSDILTVITEDVEQFVSTVEQPTVADEKTEQIIVTNVENQLNGKLEQPTVEVQEFVISNKENNKSTDDDEKPEQITTAHEEIEQPVEIKNFASTDEKLERSITTIKEPPQSVALNEKLEQPVTEEPQQQSITTNEHGTLEQTIASPEETEQSTAAIEEQKQLLTSKEKVEQSDIEIEPSEQTSSTITENEPSININEESEQFLGRIEEAQQPIASTEENNKSANEYEKLEQPVESKLPTTTNERLEQLTIEDSLHPVILNQEAVITPVEDNDYVITNEKGEQPTIEESPQSLVSNEENEQNAINGIENETSLLSNGKLEQPIIVESPQYAISDKEIEQTTVTTVKNNPITINGKLEQPTTEKSPQVLISNEKTAMTLVENNPSIMTTKKLEKPAVIESQQPIALNGEINKSTTTNKKSTATTETEQSVQAVVTTSKGNKYSDIVNKPSPKVNDESVQTTASFKKQGQSTMSKKKAISSTVSIEKKFKQSLITAEETEQVPFTNIVKESEQSKVSLEKPEQSITVMEKPCASIILNGEIRKSSTKNKKSRRSNGKKGKSTNSSVKTENSEQPDVNNQEEEEEIEPSLPSNIVQEQKPSNIESEIQNSSATPKPPSNDNTSINNENSQNSIALRSRKTKKKKPITTTTTLIEKSSSPIIPTPTSNHNLFIVIKECLRNRKIIAFKCVFILVCLCFSIIIIILFHK